MYSVETALEKTKWKAFTRFSHYLSFVKEYPSGKSFLCPQLESLQSTQGTAFILSMQNACLLCFKIVSNLWAFLYWTILDQASMMKCTKSAVSELTDSLWAGTQEGSEVTSDVAFGFFWEGDAGEQGKTAKVASCVQVLDSFLTVITTWRQVSIWNNLMLLLHKSILTQRNDHIVWGDNLHTREAQTQWLRHVPLGGAPSSQWQVSAHPEPTSTVLQKGIQQRKRVESVYKTFWTWEMLLSIFS